MSRQFEERRRSGTHVDLSLLEIDELFGELQLIERPLITVGSKDLERVATYLSGLFAGQQPAVSGDNWHEYFVFGDWLSARNDLPPGWAWARSVNHLAETSDVEPWDLFCELWREFRTFRSGSQ